MESQHYFPPAGLQFETSDRSPSLKRAVNKLETVNRETRDLEELREG